MSLNIAFFNANSIIIQFLSKYNIDVLLLSHMFLKPNQSYNIANFTTYRRDRNAVPGGGTAILIKASIRHDLINLGTFTSFEAIGVKISCNNSHACFISFYKPPNSILNEHEFLQLFNQDGSTIVAGNFNVKYS